MMGLVACGSCQSQLQRSQPCRQVMYADVAALVKHEEVLSFEYRHRDRLSSPLVYALLPASSASSVMTITWYAFPGRQRCELGIVLGLKSPDLVDIGRPMAMCILGECDLQRWSQTVGLAVRSTTALEPTPAKMPEGNDTSPNDVQPVVKPFQSFEVTCNQDLSIRFKRSSSSVINSKRSTQ